MYSWGWWRFSFHCSLLQSVRELAPERVWRLSRNCNFIRHNLSQSYLLVQFFFFFLDFTLHIRKVRARICMWKRSVCSWDFHRKEQTKHIFAHQIICSIPLITFVESEHNWQNFTIYTEFHSYISETFSILLKHYSIKTEADQNHDFKTILFTLILINLFPNTTA